MSVSEYYREKFSIGGIRHECFDTQTFFLERALDEVMPGQFLMVNVLGQGERPFSPSFTEPLLGITVRKATDPDTGNLGKVSSYMLDNLKEGDTLEILGPKGNTFLDFFDPSRPAYLVAGGCGAAPLRYFAQYLKDNYRSTKVKAFLGSTSPEQVLFNRKFSRILGEENLVVGIDEPEKPGRVVELLEEAKIKPDSQVYVCGPRPLLKSAAETAAKYIGSRDIVISAEPIMKCGRGVCGSCEIGGYKACQDGPNFTYEVLKKTEFFQYRRTKSGKRISI